MLSGTRQGRQTAGGQPSRPADGPRRRGRRFGRCSSSSIRSQPEANRFWAFYRFPFPFVFQVFVLRLIDTTTDVDIDLADYLIEQGWAAPEEGTELNVMNIY